MPLLAVLCLLVVLISITLAFLTVYTPLKVPLFESYNKELNLFFYRVPFFPKTSEQILLNAVDKNAKITSYNPNFSISAQIASSTIEAASLDLAISGPIVLNEKSVSFDIKAKAAAGYQGKNYTASLNARQLEGDLYVQISSISEPILEILSGFMNPPSTSEEKLSNPQIQNNLQKVFSYWIEYPKQNFQSEARTQLQQTTPQRSIVDQARKSAQDFLLKGNVLPEVKKGRDEKIEGVESYHLVFKPSKDSLEKAYKELSSSSEPLSLSGEFINGINAIEVHMWIGKKDAILRKTTLVMSINLDFIEKMSQSQSFTPYAGYISSLGLSPTLNISSVLVLKDVNKKFEFSQPEPALAYEYYSKKLSDAFKTEEQKIQEARLIQINKDLTAINTALTSFYGTKKRYPSTLMEMATTGFLTDTGVVKNLSTYQYRIGTRHVAVFTTFSSNSYGLQSPYYGFTSEYSYNRAITLNDLSQL